MSQKISDTTQALLNSILNGEELTPAVRADFGIDSHRHYAAISDLVLSGRVEAPELEAALGQGPKITALIGRLPDNPYRGLEFETAWDAVLKRDQFHESVRERQRER